MAKRTYDIPAAQGDEEDRSITLKRAPDGKPSQIVVETTVRERVLEPGGMGQAEFDALWAALDTLTEGQRQAALDALPEVTAAEALSAG